MRHSSSIERRTVLQGDELLPLRLQTITRPRHRSLRTSERNLFREGVSMFRIPAWSLATRSGRQQTSCMKCLGEMELGTELHMYETIHLR